uniref:Uncharacterized protein n=1 Tax=Setaria italica TaxID=4555 RepID=K3ZFU2_SETIT
MLGTHPHGSNTSLFSILLSHHHQSSNTRQGEVTPSGCHLYAKRRFGH